MNARVVPAGDAALVVELEERIDPDVNARAIAIAELLQAARLPGVRDIVPTFRSVAVMFDPLRVDYDAVLACVERSARQATSASAAGHAPVRIPVCYDHDLGPDLAEVAAFAGATDADVVRIHTSTIYRVFMLGFVAGFAYMGSIDERIAMPRHSTPRLRVPIGSVGIAGVQTGIYPAETPGGWRLVGRTPIKPFDPTRAEPFLLQAGDAVEFYAIDRVEFDRIAQAPAP
jgi:inhibitor of KinA